MSWWHDFIRVAGRRTPALAPRSQMDVPGWWKSTHFRAITRDGDKFVYCPVGNICSWSAGDYDHEWCHWCEQFFSEHVESLLGPEEQHRRLA